MKRTMKKMLSFGLVAAMSLTMLAGCGNSKDATNDTNVSNGQEEKKPTGDVKIGVLVQDVSGEEALGFRSYYENYIADQYGVTFTYTDELKDAASEKSAIEKFASQGYQAVISFQAMIVHYRLKHVRKTRFIMQLQQEHLIRNSLKNIKQMNIFLDRWVRVWIQSMKLV